MRTVLYSVHNGTAPAIGNLSNKSVKGQNYMYSSSLTKLPLTKSSSIALFPRGERISCFLSNDIFSSITRRYRRLVHVLTAAFILALNSTGLYGASQRENHPRLSTITCVSYFSLLQRALTFRSL